LTKQQKGALKEMINELTPMERAAGTALALSSAMAARANFILVIVLECLEFEDKIMRSKAHENSMRMEYFAILRKAGNSDLKVHSCRTL